MVVQLPYNSPTYHFRPRTHLHLFSNRAKCYGGGIFQDGPLITVVGLAWFGVAHFTDAH